MYPHLRITTEAEDMWAHILFVDKYDLSYSCHLLSEQGCEKAVLLYCALPPNNTVWSHGTHRITQFQSGSSTQFSEGAHV